MSEKKLFFPNLGIEIIKFDKEPSSAEEKAKEEFDYIEKRLREISAKTNAAHLIISIRTMEGHFRSINFLHSPQDSSSSYLALTKKLLDMSYTHIEDDEKKHKWNEKTE